MEPSVCLRHRATALHSSAPDFLVDCCRFSESGIRTGFDALLLLPPRQATEKYIDLLPTRFFFFFLSFSLCWLSVAAVSGPANSLTVELEL